MPGPPAMRNGPAGRSLLCVASGGSIYDLRGVNPYARVIRLAVFVTLASVSCITINPSRVLREGRCCLMKLLPEGLYKYLGCML